MISLNANQKYNNSNLSNKNNSVNHQVETTKVKKIHNKTKFKCKNKNQQLRNKKINKIKLIEIKSYKHCNHLINRNRMIAKTLKNI